MSRSPAGQPFTPPADLAARFAYEAGPSMDALSRRARRLAFNHADAEELLQDTMLHAYLGFQTFELGTNFRAWMFCILHNCWCSTYRRRQRRPGELLTEFLDEDTTQRRPTAHAPEAQPKRKRWRPSHIATSTRHWARCRPGLAKRSTSPSSPDTATPKPPQCWTSPWERGLSRVARGRRSLRITLAHAVPVRPSRPNFDTWRRWRHSLAINAVGCSRVGSRVAQAWCAPTTVPAGRG